MNQNILLLLAALASRSGSGTDPAIQMLLSQALSGSEAGSGIDIGDIVASNQNDPTLALLSQYLSTPRQSEIEVEPDSIEVEPDESDQDRDLLEKIAEAIEELHHIDEDIYEKLYQLDEEQRLMKEELMRLRNRRML